MKHTEKYLQAKWVTENPKGYDERDVARANSYCEAYLEGYNQALNITNIIEQSEQLVCDRCKEQDKEEPTDPYCMECKIEIEQQVN